MDREAVRYSAILHNLTELVRRTEVIRDVYRADDRPATPLALRPSLAFQVEPAPEHWIEPLFEAQPMRGRTPDALPRLKPKQHLL